MISDNISIICLQICGPKMKSTQLHEVASCNVLLQLRVS